MRLVLILPVSSTAYLYLFKIRVKNERVFSSSSNLRVLDNHTRPIPTHGYDKLLPKSTLGGIC